jgi:septum formation protein
MKKIILASSSPSRQQGLKQLGLNFEIRVPDIDETPLLKESPASLASRLAFEKASKNAKEDPAALWIGADQFLVLGTQLLNKPLEHNIAVEQLKASSGNTAIAYTGLCVYEPISNTVLSWLDQSKATFRTLTLPEIESYLNYEKPYQCCGSVKVEGRGISLFDKIESEDPSALLGLPLIALCRFLRQLGVFLN